MSSSSCLQMMSCTWPEPIVRVQSLSESGILAIPERYVKGPSDRPSSRSCSINYIEESSAAAGSSGVITTGHDHAQIIPVIDLHNLLQEDQDDESVALRQETILMESIGRACRDWGFFQVVNHGVSHELMGLTREVWRQFFHLPSEEKQLYANSPTTYEGYGSRLGVEKGAKLDWSDYFFLHYLPTSLRDHNKWPNLPSSCRELVGKYNEEVVKLCGKLLKILSLNLGLKEDYLDEAFGAGLDHDDQQQQAGACLRVNFYPKCPQPDLTLGLSSHSDPGGLTILLPDENVSGLQVRRAHHWITVKPLPNAFIVNIGDQIQVLSNARYRSVEHRVIVNSEKERVSLAFFYNPRGDLLIQPAPELVTEDSPALYPPMTYNDYRVFIRTRGLSGKSQFDQSLIQSPQIIQ